MEHLALLGSVSAHGEPPNLHLRQARGAYYTPESIGRDLVKQVMELVKARSFPSRAATICDPFCGDGRLISWLLGAAERAHLPIDSWTIELWDVDEETTAEAGRNVARTARQLGLDVVINSRAVNTFGHAHTRAGTVDVVVTNPPWETVKPDRRMLKSLDPQARTEYVRGLRTLDDLLAERYPQAQPSRKFAGWGTNLSRPGLVAACELLTPGGALGIVMPSSTFGDGLHVALREWLFGTVDVVRIESFAAEARHFNGMDVPFVTAVLSAPPTTRKPTSQLQLVHQPNRGPQSDSTIDLRSKAFTDGGFRLPLVASAMPLDIQEELAGLPTFGQLLEGGHFWAGRELDETGIASKLTPSGDVPFIKGRNVRRFENATQAGWLSHAETDRFPSRHLHRLVWRDVSRPSQIRRLQATLIAPGPVTGNSLGVAFSQRQSREDLLWLLGLMSSIVFESQLRALLATGHVSLGSLRSVRVPELDPQSNAYRSIVHAVEQRFLGLADGQMRLENEVAQAYGISDRSLDRVMGSHSWLPKNNAVQLTDPSAGGEDR